MNAPSHAYSIDEHRHRFAAWAAGRAASVNGCRFTVADARTLLESIGLQALLGGPEALPQPAAFDEEHARWRTQLLEVAAARGLPIKKHGVAAKLINVYLKAAFVCGGHHAHANVAALHPPIDALLLDALANRDFGGQASAWKRARDVRWSNFDSRQYQDVIDAIKVAMPERPLWEIEQHWRGFQ